MTLTSPQRVLVVDDDATVSEVVARYLDRAGFAAEVVGDGAAALDAASHRPPDLVVLDVMLPEVDGLEVLRRLRAGASRDVPVVLLTALGEESDRLAGLELGADDYVVKPFSPRELVLRVQSVLRRTAGPAVSAPVDVLRDGGIEVDLKAHRATRDGRELGLTLREYDLLAFLLQHPGQVFRREELLKHVWGWDYADHSTVTVHVRRLREKVEDDPREPTRVVTVFGLGYRYEPVG